MALAVLTAAALRLTLPAALRFHDVSWLLGVFVVGILAVLIETWGWIALIWGGIVFCAGIAIFAKRQWARWVGIITAVTVAAVDVLLGVRLPHRRLHHHVYRHAGALRAVRVRRSRLGLGLVLPVHELRLQVHRLVATAMDPLVPTKEPKEPITVTPAEIIYSVAIITTLSLVTGQFTCPIARTP